MNQDGENASKDALFMRFFKKLQSVTEQKWGEETEENI